MERPTLAKQLADRRRREEIDKLTDEECLELLLPHTFFQRIDFWVCFHLPFIHHIFWKIVCYFYPYSIDTHVRHWRRK